MEDEIAETFARMIEASCPPATIRAIESGEQDPHELWSTLEESGFLHALVPEDAGGVGLELADATGLLMLAGRHTLPLPVAETIVLRGILATRGVDIPAGSMTFAGPARRVGDAIVCQTVPCGQTADLAAVELDGQVRILPLADHRVPTVQALAEECGARWDAARFDSATNVPFDAEVPLRNAQAAVHAMQLAGALEAVLERTVAYAGERVQFGKAISKFQAIQHQLAVMAEHVLASRMAAVLAGKSGLSDSLRIAIAKARCGIAAVEVSNLAHSIHGAIGFTEEYDLQLLTRRLHLWRQIAGSELAWQEEIGRMALAAGNGPVLDLLRKASEPAQ